MGNTALLVPIESATDPKSGSGALTGGKDYIDDLMVEETSPDVSYSLASSSESNPLPHQTSKRETQPDPIKVDHNNINIFWSPNRRFISSPIQSGLDQDPPTTNPFQSAMTSIANLKPGRYTVDITENGTVSVPLGDGGSDPKRGKKKDSNKDKEPKVKKVKPAKEDKRKTKLPHMDEIPTKKQSKAASSGEEIEVTKKGEKKEKKEKKAKAEKEKPEKEKKPKKDEKEKKEKKEKKDKADKPEKEKKPRKSKKQKAADEAGMDVDAEAAVSADASSE